MQHEDDRHQKSGWPGGAVLGEVPLNEIVHPRLW
jgi:hypothetical protein